MVRIKSGLNLLFLVGNAVFISCYSSQTVAPDCLTVSNDQDIIVTTLSGAKYYFDAKGYLVVTDSSGQRVLRGRGKVSQAVGTQTGQFEGDIPTVSIADVSTSTKSALYYTPLYIMGAAVVLVVALILALNGKGLSG
jgi:hypothetical protein